MQEGVTPNECGIFHKDAYAQGKMLNSIGWNLPRGITPCDLDMVIENHENGKVLICEWSRSVSFWQSVKRGQKLVYERFVTLGKGSVYAVLCKHNVTIDREIHTARDVETFHCMFWDNHRASIDCWVTPAAGCYWRDWVLYVLFSGPQTWPQSV